jgi:hypothetical protein
MENDKIEVYNFLDMHAVINNSIIEVFRIKKLQKAFPENEWIHIKGFWGRVENGQEEDVES